MTITRVGAYAVIRHEDRILLTHQVSPGPAANLWTLPGGGVDFGEHPADAVVHEVREETGVLAQVGAILAVHDSVYDPGDGNLRHGIRLLFAASITGEPVSPDDGEIDQVAWHRVNDLPDDVTDWARLGAGLNEAQGSVSRAMPPASKSPR